MTTTRKPAAKKATATTARKSTPVRKTAAKAAPAKKTAAPKVPAQRTPRKSLKPANAGRVITVTGDFDKETLNTYVYAVADDNGALKNNRLYVLKSALGDPGEAPASVTVTITY